MFYWSHIPTLIQCGRRLHNNMTIKRQGSLRAILEAFNHVADIDKFSALHCKYSGYAT